MFSPFLVVWAWSTSKVQVFCEHSPPVDPIVILKPDYDKAADENGLELDIKTIRGRESHGFTNEQKGASKGVEHHIKSKKIAVIYMRCVNHRVIECVLKMGNLTQSC